MLALAGWRGRGKGVDYAAPASEAAVAAARDLAARTGAAVAVTGAVDYVIDGARVVACRNGHPMMTRVTGMGCTATAIVGACLAVEPDALAATAHGLAIIGVAGEIAAARSRGPGSLQVELLDALYALDAETLAENVRCRGGSKAAPGLRRLIASATVASANAANAAAKSARERCSCGTLRSLAFIACASPSAFQRVALSMRGGATPPTRIDDEHDLRPAVSEIARGRSPSARRRRSESSGGAPDIIGRFLGP